MSLTVIEDDPFKDMEEVAKLMMKGYSEYQVARRTEFKVVEVKALWAQYRERLAADPLARDAARDHLNMMVRQFDELIKGLHENLDNLETLDYDEKVSAQINTTTKNIGELQAKRVDLLQKAGLLEAGELGDELAEREEREAMIIKILQHDLCANCQDHVRDKLTALTGEVQGTVVEVVDDE